MTNPYQFDTDIWINEVELEDYGVRSVLIIEQKDAVLWDTQSHPDDTSCFLPHIKDKNLTVIYSHADWDHIWGTGVLPHEKAEIIGHDICLNRFVEDVPAKLAEKQKADPLRFEHITLLPPTRTFQNNLFIGFGNITIELHHLPGHTPDSIVGFIPEKGLLLMGDAVETPLPFVPPGCNLNRWISELKRWHNDRRVKTVIPSHGPIGGPDQIEKTISYLENLKEGTEQTFSKNVTEFYIQTHQENINNMRNSTK